MKNKQKEISILIAYIGLLLGIGAYFFVTPFAINKLGVNEFGIYNLVYTIVSYFTILDFGLGNAIIRYTAKYLALKNQKKLSEINGLFLIVYSIIGVLSLIIGLLLIDQLTTIFSALTESEVSLVSKMMKIALINIVLSFPLSIFLAILKGYEKFILAEIVYVIKILLSPMSIAIGLLAGYRSVGIVTIQTIINITLSLIPLFYCLVKLRIKISVPKTKEDLSILPEIIRFSFYVFLGVIVTKVFWSTDQIILGAFVGSAAVSLCSLITQIVQYYSTISETITKPYLSLITKDITKKERSKFNFTDIFIDVGRVQFYLLALILSGFVIFGKKFVTLWAGEELIGVYGLSTAILIPLTVPAIQNIGVSILQALNIHKFRSVVYFLLAIMNVILSLMLVKNYGVLGTTIGTVAAIVIGHIIIMNIYYKKALGLDLLKFWKNIFSILLKLMPMFVLAFFIVGLIKEISWRTLIIEIGLYTVFYIIYMYNIVLLDKEKEKIKQIIKRRRINEY